MNDDLASAPLKPCARAVTGDSSALPFLCFVLSAAAVFCLSNVVAAQRGRGGPGYPPPPGLESGGDYGGDRPRGDVIFSGGIVNRMSNKGLDVQDRSTRSGTQVQQWSYSGQPDQRWNVIELGRGEFAIVSVGTGQVLEVAGGDLRNGGRVDQNRWIGSPSQRWRLQKKGDFNELINVASGKCLEVKDKNPADGAGIQQWGCSGAGNQAWRFQK